MTSVEQVMLKLGVDNSAVASGLRSFKSKITSALSGIGAQVAGAFGIGRIIGQFNSVINKFGEIKERAQNLGVSTDFFQGLGAVADVTNSSLESVQKGIVKLAQSMGKAKEGEKTYIDAFESIGITAKELKSLSVEDVFYKMADGFQLSSDTATKTSVSMDLLGRSGSDLITLLSKGSESIKELVDGAKKLSEEEINSLAQAKDDIKQFQNDIDYGTAKGISRIADISRLLGELFSGDYDGAMAGKMFKEAAAEAKKLEEQNIAAADRAIEDALDLAKTNQDALSQEIDLTKTLAMWAKQRTAEAERLVKWQEAGNRLAQTMEDRERSVSDRSKFTLQEMVDRGSWAAQDVMDLEASARDARWEGHFAAANAMTDRSLEMRKGLADFLIDSEASPFRSMDESLKAQRESLEKLGAAVEGDALRVIPVNGE